MNFFAVSKNKVLAQIPYTPGLDVLDIFGQICNSMGYSHKAMSIYSFKSVVYTNSLPKSDPSLVVVKLMPESWSKLATAPTKLQKVRYFYVDQRGVKRGQIERTTPEEAFYDFCARCKKNGLQPVQHGESLGNVAWTDGQTTMFLRYGSEISRKHA